MGISEDDNIDDIVSNFEEVLPPYKSSKLPNRFLLESEELDVFFKNDKNFFNKLLSNKKYSIEFIQEYTVWPHEKIERPKKKDPDKAYYSWPVDEVVSKTTPNSNIMPRGHISRCQNTLSNGTQCYYKQTNASIYCINCESSINSFVRRNMSVYAKLVHKTMASLLDELSSNEKERKSLNSEIDLARAAIIPLVKIHSSVYYDETIIANFEAEKNGKMKLELARQNADNLLYQRIDAIGQLALKAAKIDALTAGKSSDAITQFLAGVSKTIEKEFEGEPERARLILDKIASIPVASEKATGINITIE